MPASPPRQAIARLVERALIEDLERGDATSNACVGRGASGSGRVVAREALVVAGLAFAAETFRQVDPDLALTACCSDGDRVEGGTLVAEVSGPLRSLLAAERTALNFLQRASGIASMTRRCVDRVADLGVEIVDTRKTAPGLRLLDKHAVRCGGGVNHRLALDDLLMVKDNHVAAAGSLEVAVERALAAAGFWRRVEVEVDTPDQLDRLLALPQLPDIVLLDNFTPDEVARAVERVAGRLRVEVSGGIDETNLRAFAEAGPDAVSLGALTHSVRAADLALDLDTLEARREAPG